MAIATKAGGEGEAWGCIDLRVSCIEVSHLLKPIAPFNDFMAIR